jgi:colanic acid biosynthesis glycosyl transferase WcaI
MTGRGTKSQPCVRAPLAIFGLNYAPEEVGIGPFTTGLARGLTVRGFDVTAIVGQPYYPQWHKRPGLAGLRWRRSVEEGVTVVRCPHYVPARPSGARRIAHLASFALASLPSVVGLVARPRPQRPRMIVCIAPALLSIPVAWLAARLCGARLWVHVQDFEVEAAFAMGLMRRGPLAWIGAGLERWLLRLADRVSTISPQMCAKLVAKSVRAERVVELRNWANVCGPSRTGEDYRQRWGLVGKRVALYSGNIANKQGIDIVIKAARELSIRKDIVFVICGEGPNRSPLEQQASDLTNVQFHDLQPAERLGDLLALADVHLLPQLAGAADLVLPSKLANMLFSGKPVVATAAPGTGLYAEVDGCGINTPPGDHKGFAAAVAELADDPTLAKRLGLNGIDRANSRWSQSRILDRFAEAVQAQICD